MLSVGSGYLEIGIRRCHVSRDRKFASTLDAVHDIGYCFNIIITI